MKHLIILNTVLPTIVMAAGSGSRDPMQLFWGAVFNFTLVLAVFIWKGVPALRTHFVTKHDDINELSKRAQTLKFEAQMQLEKQEKKNNQLDQTVGDIMKKADEEIAAFKTQKVQENSKQIDNLNKDLDNKVELAKNEVVSKINDELIAKVVETAKQKVKGNPQLQSKITSQITSRL